MFFISISQKLWFSVFRSSCCKLETARRRYCVLPCPVKQLARSPPAMSGVCLNEVVRSTRSVFTTVRAHRHRQSAPALRPWAKKNVQGNGHCKPLFPDFCPRRQRKHKDPNDPFLGPKCNPTHDDTRTKWGPFLVLQPEAIFDVFWTRVHFTKIDRHKQGQASKQPSPFPLQDRQS